MSQLMLAGTSPSITSREIAELVESRHDNVRVAIERLADRGVIALPAAQEKATGGRPSLAYVFSGEQGKRDSIVVVAQLSPEFTARLVDRWQELERRVAAPADPLAILSDPVTLRGLLGTYASRVEELTPKAEALDRIATAEGSLTLREAAKAMQIPERKFLEMLQLKLWIYRHPFSATFFAYAGPLRSGFLKHKVFVGTKPDGSELVRTQVRVTAKGLTNLANALSVPAAAIPVTHH
ncbi:phage antirepressor KilAC domain-containing protein [Xanthomonas campestris pv. raphani]|uniref:phage antirepressor KilAC domain-containing protein n=1 Tax=Xanthomonas campestris TaxID=339 RepID=UPI002B226478|nr:phage antirepressor KilAC domain-containing protein [Xanthomonas campestris]MEA9653066.1 phage antirepressor KilAC domain-containing protein [Xanthomonas campestris pv. raphani]MEB1025994.1 phage antirepressor KilAC domain-containing protein [Xanthomonas campestris pv. campestris]MEB1146707.1 phage antirepressor KilAC domain-containing protein [Xanthomonas campestris pv. campestris]MEB1937019.1 phage antirepressor KilAC domain-containing protein [Xanthomonas campestris pv. campestris]